MASSSPSPPTSSRRAFLLCGVQCLGGLCAVMLGGCTLPVRSFRSSATHVIKIPIARYPELEQPGGILKIRHVRLREIYLRRQTDSYVALSAICTHQGCVVAPAPGGFECPCHGSSYDHQGVNTGGPAPRPLTRFPVEEHGDTVHVLLVPRKQLQ